MFDNLKYQIITRNGIKEIIRNNNILIRSINRGGLYYVMASPEINVSHTSNDNVILSQTEMWHARLGHIGNFGLNKLFVDGLIDRKLVDMSCEYCVLGKKTSHSFSNSTYKASVPREYVYSDLWGPAQVGTIFYL
ncbi:uncharacterized protein [Phyllobates terribilis]|uniref:uncharacterized protein n=1 Tax=Phyllobates terribilis TaxID=111132 RepID=UPI003CCA7B1B